jgi:thiol-disulfide isomerase/thioredoxin
MGCGPSDQALQDHERVRALLARVEALELAQRESLGRETALVADVARLHGTQAGLAARVGLTAFEPKVLLRFPVAGRLSLPDVLQVDGPTAKSQRLSVQRLIAARRGAVIVFWATWCVPCISDEELAYLAVLKEQLAASDVALLPLAVDGLDKVQAHEKASRWIYPLCQRDDAQLEILPKAFVEQNGVNLPLFLVVGADGVARWYHNRKLDDAVVQEIAIAASRLPPR